MILWLFVYDVVTVVAVGGVVVAVGVVVGYVPHCSSRPMTSATILRGVRVLTVAVVVAAAVVDVENIYDAIHVGRYA